MHNSLKTSLLFCAVVAMCLAGSACSYETTLQAEVKWDDPTAPNSYAFGKDKDEAFRLAKWSCSATHRDINGKKRPNMDTPHCYRRPLEVNFTHPPRGMYTNYCKNCRVHEDDNGHDILTCATCEKGIYVDENNSVQKSSCAGCDEWSGPQDLDLSQCSYREKQDIEDCYGKLICGRCKPRWQDAKPY